MRTKNFRDLKTLNYIKVRSVTPGNNYTTSMETPIPIPVYIGKRKFCTDRLADYVKKGWGFSEQRKKQIFGNMLVRSIFRCTSDKMIEEARLLSILKH